MDPGQNEESALVGDQVNVLPTDCDRPANKTVAATNMPGCRTVDHTGDRPLMGKDQILEVLSHRLAIAQIMILLDQAITEFLKGRTPHLADLKGENRREGTPNGCGSIAIAPGFFRSARGLRGFFLLAGSSI